MKQYRIIISGGGTGGHIFPAISIANTFRKRFPEAEILFVGADDRMEMEKVPAAGYRIVGLPVSGFDRAHLANNIRVAGRLLKSLKLAKKTIREFKSDIAVGVGGYASGPTLWMAASLGIPTLIQEQNSYAGVTNKLLAKKAGKICVAYEGMEKFFPADRIVVTGNPVRQDLEEASDKREEALKFFGLSPDKKTILVVGGSLGARTINRSIQGDLDKLFASDVDVQVIWQTGRYYHEEALKHLKAYRGMPIWCSDFITRMDYAYAAADLIISRGRRQFYFRTLPAEETSDPGPFSQCGGRPSDEECFGIGGIKMLLSWWPTKMPNSNWCRRLSKSSTTTNVSVSWAATSRHWPSTRARNA